MIKHKSVQLKPETKHARTIKHAGEEEESGLGIKSCRQVQGSEESSFGRFSHYTHCPTTPRLRLIGEENSIKGLANGCQSALEP